MNFYLGIDFGTSGARGIVIDLNEAICTQVEYSFSKSTVENWAIIWQTTLFSLIEKIPTEIREKIKAIAINGTSASVLLCDRNGNPITAPLLYNDSRGIEVLDKVKAIAPPNHVVISSTSSLAKLFWYFQQPITPPLQRGDGGDSKLSQAVYFLHQADWLAFLLHGKLGISDYHNALKLGYDVHHLCYPQWLEELPFFPLLPQVVAPGTPIGEVTPEVAQQFGLQPDCLVCAGTTDSIAAFLASGVTTPGEAVTSLGSTLVLKLLSLTPVEDARYGIYSHRLDLSQPPLVKGGSLGKMCPQPHQGKGGSKVLWLTGGASNTGGAVLRHFFSDAELVSLSREINGEKMSDKDYYPLLKKGDRFPVNDPELPPRLTPRPDNSVQFLHGLLEGMARIEALGYRLLQELGATPLTRVYTAGGGAKNLTWQIIRQRNLGVPVQTSVNTAAAFGSALLAKNNVLG